MYAAATKKNLAIYDIQEQNLRGYTTTEKDFKKKIDRFPPEDFRNTSMDIIKDQA